MATKKNPTDKPKKAKKPNRPKGENGAAKEAAAAPEKPAESAAPAGDQTNLRIETYMAELPCKLTEEDVKKRAKLAAKLVARRVKVRDRAKLEAKARRAEIAEIDQQIDTHSQEVREEITHQMVKCERRFNYETKRVTDYRMDSGEELTGSTRDMTDAELQTFLNFEEPLPPPPGGGSAEDDLDDEFGGGDEPAGDEDAEGDDKKD